MDELTFSKFSKMFAVNKVVSINDVLLKRCQ